MGKVQLHNLFKNLKMDSNITDTKKAEEYLARYTDFRSDSSIEEYEAQEVARDGGGNKIFCLPFDNLYELYLTGLPQIRPEQLQTRLDGLRKLAEEIEKETELIFQLEYLIRKIPERETKHSIQLIVQHLVYSSQNLPLSDERIIFIQNNTPLLALGTLCQSLKLYDYTYLFATHDTAVICHLFTELCKKSGLDFVKLVIGESNSILITRMKFDTFQDIFNNVSPAVIGVITEKSDVDSAVERLLNSEYHPFPLTRIFVQESIYKDFKDIMAWKCKSQENTTMNLKSLCSDAFTYETKTFYLDYTGNLEEIKNQKDQAIVVEAYRTTTELLSLLNKTNKRLCLSLWASGISEANEIALKVNIPVVWINDYYNFNGPNKVSKAVFDKMYQRYSIDCDETIVKQLQQQQKAWKNQTFDDRYEKVLKAFEFVDEELADIIREKSVPEWKYDDLVALQNKTMIVGFSSSIDIVGLWWSTDKIYNVTRPKRESVWLNIAKAFINGSAFAYRTSPPECDDAIMFNKLAKRGLPVAEIKTLKSLNSKIPVSYSFIPDNSETKVIWTSFGTTFAN